MPGRSFSRVILGHHMRELRERANVAAEAALAAIDKEALTQDTLRKFELGDRLFTKLEVTTLARLYGCTEAEIIEVRELWDAASRPSVFSSFGLPENVVAYLDLERAATMIRAVSTLVVPGIFQTPSYAQRLFELGDVEIAITEQRVQARLKRQDRLRPSEDNPDPARLFAVIGEEAVRRCAREPGGVDQLDALREFANLENVEIRIVDLDAGLHAGALGDFTLLEFPPGTVDNLVYLETAGGGQANDARSIVERLGRRFEQLRGQALDPTKSLALLDNTR